MVVLPQDVFDALNDLDLNPKETREVNAQFEEDFKKERTETTEIEEQVVQKQEERIKDPTLSSKEKTLYRNIGKEFFKSSKTVIMKIRKESIFRDMMAAKDKVMNNWFVKTPLNAAKKVVSSSLFKKAMKIIGMFSLIWLLLQTFFDDVIDNILKKFKPYIKTAMENYIVPLLNALGNMYRAFEEFVLYCIGVEEGQKNLLKLVKDYFDVTRTDYDEKNTHSLLGVMYKAVHSIIYDDLNIFGIRDKIDSERDEIQTNIVRFKTEANRLVNTKIENVQEEINKKRQEEAAQILQSSEVQEMLKLTVVNQGWQIDGSKFIIDGKVFDANTQALEISEKLNQLFNDETKDLDVISENVELRTLGEIDPSKTMTHIAHALSMTEGDLEKAKSGWKGSEGERKLYKEREQFLEAIANDSSLSPRDASKIAVGLSRLQKIERHRISSENEQQNITRFLENKKRVMGNAYALENTMAGRNELTSYKLDEISTRDKTLYSGLASLRKLMEGFFHGGGSSGMNSFVSTVFVNIFAKLFNVFGMNDVSESITGVQQIHGNNTKITDTADKENIKYWEMGMDVGYEMESTGSVLNLITIDTTNPRPLQNALFLFNQYVAHLSQETQATNEELLNTISVFKTTTKYIKENTKIFKLRVSSGNETLENPIKQRLERIIKKIKNNEKLTEEEKVFVGSRTIVQLEEELRIIEVSKPTMTDLSNDWLTYLIYKIRGNQELTEKEKTVLGSRTLVQLEEELERRGLTHQKYIEERNIVIPVLPPKSHLVIDGTAISLAAAISSPDT